MPLPSTGQALSLQDINVELLRSATATISMNDTDLRALLEVPGGGVQISLAAGWGKSYATKAGYWAGGLTSAAYPIPSPAASFSTAIDGILFDTETATDPAAVLSVPRFGIAGLSPESGVQGYFAGGFIYNGPTPGAAYATAEIDGMNFATLAATNTSASLSPSPISEGSSAGNLGGGDAGYIPRALPSSFTNGRKFTFSTETVTACTPFVTPGMPGNGRFFIGDTTAWFAVGGGLAPPTLSGRPLQAFVLRYQTSNDTVTNPASLLHRGMNGGSEASAPTKGYMIGGSRAPSSPPYPLVSAIDRFTYASETSATTGASLIPGGDKTGYGTVESTSRAYFGGGRNTGPVASMWAGIEGFTFDTETNIDPAATLSVVRDSVGGIRKR